MGIDFGALRQRKGSNMGALQKKLEKTGQSGGGRDPRIWTPKANSDMTAQCIVRFLPIPKVDYEGVEAGTYNEEDLTPAAKIIRHYFKGPGGNYSENSPATFGEECPVLEYNREQWALSEEMTDKMAADAIQNGVRRRKRNISYFSNVYVIQDKNNPENQGKVMLYKYGETIRKKLEEASNPKFDTDPAFDPFDFWEGADLILNLTYEKKKIGDNDATVPIFDAVKWATPAPAFGGDEEKMSEVWAQEHSIAEFYDRSKFKSYDALKAKFNKVMGLDAGTGAPKDMAPTPQERVASQGSAPEPEAGQQSVASSSLPPRSKPEPQAAPSAPDTTSTGGAVESTVDEFEAMLAEMD